MATFRKMLFGRILERDVAVATDLWNARAYFACTGVLAVTSLLLSIPWMLGVALAFCACAYFVGFKVSRMAAMIDLPPSAACFALFYRAWPPALVVLTLSPLE